jgi:hypothetical protein
MRLTSFLLFLPSLLAAQAPAAVQAERADLAEWLVHGENSPYAAVARAAVGNGLVLGPDGTEVPLTDLARTTVEERNGVVRLSGPDGTRLVPRSRGLPLGPYRIQASGPAGRGVITVYGEPSGATPPVWYPWRSDLVFTGPLVPAREPVRRMILTMDGVEVEATVAGEVRIPTGGGPAALQVYRVPVPGTEERELTIYVRDATNDHGSYPAGRFVTLEPVDGTRYRLDFNRARNPFCAYNTVYACPAPWPGNTLTVPIEAGERYEPHEGQ